MNSRWYAVRCCCNGARVLGFLSLPESFAPVHIVVEKSEAVPMFDARNEPGFTTVHQVQLRAYGNEIAVYSEDRPIEFWRKIRGFMEVQQ